MAAKESTREFHRTTGRAIRSVDPALETALASLGPVGTLIGHRVITLGDEDALLPAEQIGFGASVQKVRRQSGAARILARDLLERLGIRDVAIPRSESGAPIWPPGVVGSLAHDGSVAVAAIADARRFAALGIDVEPADPLPPGLVELVATPVERGRYSSAVLHSRVLFVVKEAIYKALNPTDGVFLEFQDVEVDLLSNVGWTRTGRTIAIAFSSCPRVIALSFVLH